MLATIRASARSIPSDVDRFWRPESRASTDVQHPFYANDSLQIDSLVLTRVFQFGSRIGKQE
jgi:hypothetical protein